MFVPNILLSWTLGVLPAFCLSGFPCEEGFQLARCSSIFELGGP